MACRQVRSISGLVEDILKWARQDLKRVWLASSSGLTCRSSSGASHLVATSMAGMLEFVKAATAIHVSLQLNTATTAPCDCVSPRFLIDSNTLDGRDNGAAH